MQVSSVILPVQACNALACALLSGDDRPMCERGQAVGDLEGAHLQLTGGSDQISTSSQGNFHI